MPRKYTKNKVTKDKLKQIVEARSVSEASRISGVTVGWCFQLRKRHGIGRVQKRFDEQDTKKVIDYYSRGFKIYEIARVMQRSYSTISKKIIYMRKNGQI